MKRDEAVEVPNASVDGQGRELGGGTPGGRGRVDEGRGRQPKKKITRGTHLIFGKRNIHVIVETMIEHVNRPTTKGGHAVRGHGAGERPLEQDQHEGKPRNRLHDAAGATDPGGRRIGTKTASASTPRHGAGAGTSMRATNLHAEEASPVIRDNQRHV